MNKINEIITTKTGMASYVDLRKELFDTDACSKRIANYKPIKSHRDVFERVSKALDPKDRRCYLLTGSYGTGKSHICLMLAAYFMYQSDVPELQEFFSSYSDEDESRAKVLANKRAKGRYLVAVPEFGSSGSFEELLLRSINEALKREEFEEYLDSHYQEAIRRIDKWKEEGESGLSRVNFYRLFCEEIKEKFFGWTENKLLKGLKEYDHEAYKAFCQIHKNITSNDFSYDKDNIVDIISAINSSKKFQERFKGIVIIFDEFGYLLQDGRVNLNSFHAFSQLCTYGDRSWRGNQLLFIGTGHKPFSSYAKMTTAVDISTISDRIDEIPLQTQGMEDIIAAIIIPQKNHHLWQEYVKKQEGIFNQFAKECKRLNIFNWLPVPKLRERIIENIYPMHPLATYCLLILAKEIGSANRSVFTFFSGEFELANGSYPWFIQNNNIVDDRGHLILYTTGYLFDYFQNSLFSSNRELREVIRGYIKNYEETVRELNRYVNQKEQGKLFDEKDELMEWILKVMLIHEIVSVNNSKENIYFSMNVSTPEQKEQIDKRLSLLTKITVLYHNPINDVYEFRQSDAIDIDKKIDGFTSIEENYPKNIIEKLEEFVPLLHEERYLEAKDYNQNHSEDKRLLRIFCSPDDLTNKKIIDGKEKSFFDILKDKIHNEKDFKKSYEGIAIYIICENRESIDISYSKIVNNPSGMIVFALPMEPIPIGDIIFKVLAIENIKKSEKYDDFSTQDRALLKEREKQYKDQLIKERNKYLSAKFIKWYGKQGKVIQVSENKDYDIANKVIEPIYYQFSNKFSHDEFNKIHNIRFDRNRNQALKEAVEKILNLYEHIIIDTEFGQNRGEIRYIQRCFLNPGALRQIDKKGSKLYCEPERDLTKFNENIPALADMIQEIEQIKDKKKINFKKMVNKYLYEYGQGFVAISLMFSLVYRYFKDNIQIKRDDTAIGNMKLGQFEEIYDLLTGQYPNAYLEHRKINESERDFIDHLYDVFSDKKLTANENATITRVYELLKDWWNNLPPITKVKNLYNDDIEKFLEVFEKIESRDEYSFILGELQTIYEFEPDELITNEKLTKIIGLIEKDKEKIEVCEKKVENKILDGICKIFEIEKNTYKDIQDGINTWFNLLNEYQRDPITYDIKESKALASHLGSIDSIENTFFKELPSSEGFNLGEVKEWTVDKTNDYLNKINIGKKDVEENKFRLENAEIILSGDYKEPKENFILYSGEIHVQLKHKDPGIKIYITTDGSDPKSSNSCPIEAIGQRNIEIKDNIKLNYISYDKEDNNYSCLKTIIFTNNDKKYEISLLGQQTIGEQQATFYFPGTLKGFEVTLKSLLRNALELKIIDKNTIHEEIEKVIKGILEE
jgi:hypothetical protein